MTMHFKWPFAGKPTVTPLQMAGMVHAMIVEQGERDRAGALGFPLKRPASEALFKQCRLYRDAGADLMLQAKAIADPKWAEVVKYYHMLLSDNPNAATRAELNLAGSRLGWIRKLKGSRNNIEDLQEWGLSWLTDVGHADEDNHVTQGLVVVKWEFYLHKLVILIESQRLVIPATA